MAEKPAQQQPPSPVRSGMRHNEDIRCIVSTFLFFLVFVITWHYFSSPLAGGWVSLILWLSLFQLSFMGAVTTHNAIHLPVFWSRSWNNFYQICLSLQYGGAVTVFIPGHNLSHHKYPQQARDVMRTTKVRYSWNLLNGLLFFWHVVLSGNKDDKLYFEAQARLNRPIVRQRRREEIAVWGTTAVLILIDWRRWIWFALLPQFYAKYCILSLNFLQHDGCDMSSKYNFARNFTGKTINYLCFNNGYHTVHHLYPGLHWSVLPEKHQELIGPHIAESLESSDMLVYIWKSFIYPGLRVDYTGRPLVITKEENEMRDEPWFYDGSETFSNTKEYLSQDSIYLAHIVQRHSADATFCCVIYVMGIRFKNKPGDQVRSLVFDALNGRRNVIAKGPAMAACGRSFLTSDAQQIQEQQDESMTSQADDVTSPLQHEMRSESHSLGESTGTIPLPTTSTVHRVPGAQITDEACQVGPFYILDDEPTVSPTIDIPQSFNVFPVDTAHTAFEDTFALSPSSMLPGQTSFRTGGFDWLNFDIGNSPQGFQLDTFYNSYIPEFWSSSTVQQVPESAGPNSGDIGNGVQHKMGNGDSVRDSQDERQPDIEQNTLAWPFDQAHKQSPHRYQLPPLRDILNGYCPTDRPRPVQTTLVKGFIQILSENPLPQLETLRDPHSIQAFCSLQRLVDSYFSRFHDIQAIIHKPTWTMSACPPILLTAMASVGALLSDSQSDYELSVALSEICSTMINWMGASDATNYSDVSYLNALCLYQIYSLGSGKRQLYQNADRSRGLLIGGLRGIGLLNPRSSITLSQDHDTIRGSEDDSVLANDWKNWVKMESGRRAAWAAFEYDCSLCTLTSRRGIVDLSELPSELPCPESMWNASSARAWFALMSRLGQDDSRPNLSKVLKQALAGRELPTSLGSWAKRLCAQVIGRLLWDLWQIEVVAMPEYLGLGSIVAAHQDTKRSLLKGLNNLVESLSSPSSTSDLTSYNIASLLCHYSHLCAANGVLDLILSIVRGLISTEPRVHEGIKVARNRLKSTFARDPKTARRLCWHAAQIVAIANEYLVSAPCEIMRVFMGYIFIIAYSAYGDHTRTSPMEVTQSVRLDLHDQNLSHRRVVVKWIEVGGPASSGSVGDIGAEGCVPAISADAQEILKKLQCWGLAHKFTKVFQVLETKGL
ncbi:hypothetical protein FNAPI_3233 [Fusarium napiforme]|uniref:Transcription factor domain-containing protein n=1 Tax=Fusarium napiforme TaxID=42672 RepID=A0A8H5JX06_9HYPO|nr:hypothetical protein FNAPI_3233 [Fusarium napiforme]